MQALGLHLGDRVTGRARRGGAMHVVGKVLLPASSHTDYDESAWMTLPALRQADPTGAGPDSIEDYVLVRFQSGADVAAAHKRLARLGGPEGYFLQPAKLAELRHQSRAPPGTAVRPCDLLRLAGRGHRRARAGDDGSAAAP